MRSRRRRWLDRVPLGVQIPVFAVVMVVLLPVGLPIAVALDAMAFRRLARTRCGVCGNPIGLAELRRARDAARAQAAATAKACLDSGMIPRVVVDWDVTCPTCGQAYTVPQGSGREELVMVPGS